MRGWTLAVALLVALSGCFGGDGGEDDNGDGHDDPDDGMGGNMTDNMTANAPPRIAFFADNNTLPMEEPAVFNLNVTDDDGDFLDFTIDADGDGEADTTGSLAPLDGVYDPFNFTYSYSAAGLYNATLNLTDGEHVIERVIAMNITEGANAGPALAPFEPITYSEDVVIQCVQCTESDHTSSVSWNAGSQGIDAIWVDLPPEAAGYPFTIESSFGDPDARILDSCDGGAVLGSLGASGPESGTVPAGAGCIVAWEWVGGASTITIAVG